MNVPDILPHGNRREEFEDQAVALHELADAIGRGEILSAAWVFIHKDSGKTLWTTDRFKGRGVSMLELSGAMHQAAHELS